MKLSAMRFKGFTWHHNPKSLTIKCSDKIVSYSYPHFRAVVESFYSEPVTVSGVGELYGEDCLKQYERLQELYKEGKSGVLCLPKLMPIYACFEKLNVEASTTPSLLTYSFTFRQVKQLERLNNIPKTYTLTEDCTLFDVAYQFNVGLESLVEINNNIMFINELKAGQVVRLC